MSILFWDASALAKRYVPEPGASTIDALFTSSNSWEWWIAHLGYLEAYWVLVRKHNRGEINQLSFATAVRALRNEVINDSRFGILSLTSIDVFGALDLVLRHSLNSTDAALLSLYLRFYRTLRTRESAYLVTDDTRLIRASDAEGLPTLNPETVPPDEAMTILA